MLISSAKVSIGYPCPSAIADVEGCISSKDFFMDCPWLNLDPSRLGTMIPQRMYPSVGLLGGSSTPSSGKPTKLAALAAARRRQADEKASSEDSSETNGTTNLLQKLELEDKANRLEFQSEQSAHPATTTSPQSSTYTAARTYRSKKNRDRSPDPSKKLQPGEDSKGVKATGPGEEISPTGMSLAEPSAFANTLIGMTLPAPKSFPRGKLTAYPFANIPKDAFSGPSPDDVVEKARNSKSLDGSRAKRAKK